jgi:hypothetical protein
MVEEERLDGRLQEIDQVVVAADVRELVREEGLDRFRRKSRGGAEGKQDDGPDRSERRRDAERR